MALFKRVAKYQVRGFDPRRAHIAAKTEVATNNLQEAHAVARKLVRDGFYDVAVHYMRRPHK